MIRHTTITDALLISSDVSENDYAEFAMGTTYALGTRVIDSTGVEVLTLDVAPATAWAVGDLITGQTSAKTARVVAQLTTKTYQIRERSGAFTLDESIGVTGTPAKIANQGAAYPTVTAATDKVHRVYESLQANNLAHYPPTNTSGTTPYWLDCGYTNRWKMFDQITGSQTAKADTITVSIKPGIVDSIAFINVDATEIDITMTDPVEGVVFEETIDLLMKSNVNDWYSYFFEPIIAADAAVLLGIPPYGAATIAITFTKPGGTAKCGACVVGMGFDFGGTQYKPNKGITSYSRKTVNDFGEYVVTKRANAKKMSATVMVPNTMFDSVDSILTQYDSEVVVWIGVDAAYSAFIMMGFYQDYNLSMDYPEDSLLSLEITGVI